jgi:hypothetical protein
MNHLHFRQNLKSREITGGMKWLILPITENRFRFRKDSNKCQGFLVSLFYDLLEMTNSSFRNAQIQGDQRQYVVAVLKS